MVAGLLATRYLLVVRAARHRAEESLGQSARFVDTLLELLPVMVVVKEGRGLRFTRFNRAAEEIAGLARTSVTGRTDFELFPKPVAQSVTTLDRAVLASHDVRDIPEEVFVAPSGAVRTLHTRKVAVRDAAGAPEFLLSVSEDITERKRAEADLRRARDTAEAALHGKSEFLVKMGRELRTPLNSIVGIAQLLDAESAGPLNDRQREYIGQVIASGRHLLGTMDDIVDLTQIEAGRIELRPVETPLGALLADTIRLVQPIAVAAELRVVLNAAANLPDVTVDEAKFRQLLELLLGRAIRSTPAGGTITIDVRGTGRRLGAGSTVRISVVDTGPGVRPEDLERIFLEFEPADASRPGTRPPSGVGLALARRLVELHGGRLWAESEIGLGTSLHAEIPSTLPLPNQSTPLVLLLEHDQPTGEALRHHLEKCQCRVASVKTGGVVMERIRELQPDAIVVDMVHRDDGLALLQALKEDPRTAGIPVCVAAVVDGQVRALALGEFDWLPKPVRREAMVAAMQRALTGAAASHPLVIAVDDDGGTLDLVAAMLEGAGFRVLTTTDREQGLQLIDTLSPSGVVVGLSLDGGSGFEFAATLRTMPRTAAVAIVILSEPGGAAAARERIQRDVRQILSLPGRGTLIQELGRLPGWQSVEGTALPSA